WSLNVTVSVPHVEQRAKGGAVALDLGWRLLESGAVRVAYWTNTQGKHGEVIVSQRDIGEFCRVKSLRSKCDSLRDEFLPSLVEWLVGREFSDEWKQQTTAVPQWRSVA